MLQRSTHIVRRNIREEKVASSSFFFLFLLCRLARGMERIHIETPPDSPPRRWLQSWSEWTFYERHDDCTLRAMYNKSCIHIPRALLERAAWDAHYISTKSHESEHDDDESWVEWRRKSELERMHQTLILSACFCSVEFQLEKSRWWYAAEAGAAATVENTQIFDVDFSLVIVVESLSAFELLIYSQKATKNEKHTMRMPSTHKIAFSNIHCRHAALAHRRHDVKILLHFPTAKALWTSTLMHSRLVQPIMMSWVFNDESGFCRKVGGDGIAVILNIEPSSMMTQTDVQTHSKGWISWRNKECEIFDFSGLVLSGSSLFLVSFFINAFLGWALIQV